VYRVSYRKDRTFRASLSIVLKCHTSLRPPNDTGDESPKGYQAAPPRITFESPGELHQVAALIKDSSSVFSPTANRAILIGHAYQLRQA
jgi:hypothetical protein